MRSRGHESDHARRTACGCAVMRDRGTALVKLLSVDTVLSTQSTDIRFLPADWLLFDRVPSRLTKMEGHRMK